MSKIILFDEVAENLSLNKLFNEVIMVIDLCKYDCLDLGEVELYGNDVNNESQKEIGIRVSLFTFILASNNGC